MGLAITVPLVAARPGSRRSPAAEIAVHVLAEQGLELGRDRFRDRLCAARALPLRVAAPSIEIRLALRGALAHRHRVDQILESLRERTPDRPLGVPGLYERRDVPPPDDPEARHGAPCYGPGPGLEPPLLGC